MTYPQVRPARALRPAAPKAGERERPQNQGTRPASKTTPATLERTEPRRKTTSGVFQSRATGPSALRNKLRKNYSVGMAGKSQGIPKSLQNRRLDGGRSDTPIAETVSLRSRRLSAVEQAKAKTQKRQDRQHQARPLRLYRNPVSGSGAVKSMCRRSQISWTLSTCDLPPPLPWTPLCWPKQQTT